MSITFDPKSYTPQEFEKIPIGPHRVRISKIEDKVSKSGNNMKEIVLEVSGYNRKLWVYIVEGEYANQNIGNILGSCGLLEIVEDEGFSWNLMIGKIGGVQVKHDGDWGEKVAYWLRREKVEELPGWIEGKRTESVEVEDEDVPF